MGTSTAQVSRSTCYDSSAENAQLLAKIREISKRKEEEEELNYKVKDSEMYGLIITYFVNVIQVHKIFHFGVISDVAPKFMDTLNVTVITSLF